MDMNHLALRLGETDLRITATGRTAEAIGQPYLDWLECELQVRTPYFSGSVGWSVMPQELAGLADQLVRLYDGFPKPGSLSFEPSYPNLAIHLQIGSRGEVIGRCSIVDDRLDADRLQFHFTIEQSQLPKIANDIRAFLRSMPSPG
jgi:hypothetical protein